MSCSACARGRRDRGQRLAGQRRVAVDQALPGAGLHDHDAQRVGHDVVQLGGDPRPLVARREARVRLALLLELARAFREPLGHRLALAEGAAGAPAGGGDEQRRHHPASSHSRAPSSTAATRAADRSSPARRLAGAPAEERVAGDQRVERERDRLERGDGEQHEQGREPGCARTGGREPERRAEHGAGGERRARSSPPAQRAPPPPRRRRPRGPPAAPSHALRAAAATPRPRCARRACWPRACRGAAAPARGPARSPRRAPCAARPGDRELERVVAEAHAHLDAGRILERREQVLDDPVGRQLDARPAACAACPRR